MLWFIICIEVTINLCQISEPKSLFFKISRDFSQFRVDSLYLVRCHLNLIVNNMLFHSNMKIYLIKLFCIWIYFYYVSQVTYKPIIPEARSPIIAEFENAGNKTMADVFSWAVQRYGARRFLGTRDILGEDDEIQPNGRIFAKLELGDYRLVGIRITKIFICQWLSLIV